jgi:hypothetical protein
MTLYLHLCESKGYITTYCIINTKDKSRALAITRIIA